MIKLIIEYVFFLILDCLNVLRMRVIVLCYANVV